MGSEGGFAVKWSIARSAGNAFGAQRLEKAVAGHLFGAVAEEIQMMGMRSDQLVCSQGLDAFNLFQQASQYGYVFAPADGLRLKARQLAQ